MSNPTPSPEQKELPLDPKVDLRFWESEVSLYPDTEGQVRKLQQFIAKEIELAKQEERQRITKVLEHLLAVRLGLTNMWKIAIDKINFDQKES